MAWNLHILVEDCNGIASMTCLDVLSSCKSLGLFTLMGLSVDPLQDNVDSLQVKATCQAMAALLLAKVHAPDLKPATTLTDLRDSHSIFWLDGFSIMYYAALDAATAWALTKALLVPDPEGHSNNLSLDQLPQSLEPFAKRQKLDVYGMRSSGGKLAQLAGQSAAMRLS